MGETVFDTELVSIDGADPEEKVVIEDEKKSEVKKDESVKEDQTEAKEPEPVENPQDAATESAKPKKEL